jgi:uncharacterized protein (TIGR02599 family)
MLVSITILLVIVGILFGMTQETSNVWKNTTGKVEVFKNARTAFEVMTRTISQATLNTYYDYATVNGNAYSFVSLGSETSPTTYARNSDLQIVSGQGTTLLSSVTGTYTPVTHSIFFQTPLGIVSNSSYSNLSGLLNACGFYIVYGPDNTLPSFLPSVVRYRYRLMQFTQSSENLSIYAGNKGTSNWYLPFIKSDLASTTSTSNTVDATLAQTTSDFVLAENIIALVILPKLSSQDEALAETTYGTAVTGTMGTALAPNYAYNSTTIGQALSLSGSTGLSQYPLLNSYAQMPPVMQVTMVAIDEASAAKLGNTTTPPNTQLGLSSTLFTQAKNFQTDLASLTGSLTAAHMNFKVFQTNVAIRNSKWTSDN